MTRSICIWAALAFLAGAGTSLLGGDPAPVDLTYKGKPLMYWMAALESGRPASATPKQADAEEAIHSIGPEAVPAILRYRRGTPAQRLEVIRHACAILSPDADVKLVDAIKDPDPSTREMALEVLPDSAVGLGIDDVVRAVADPVRSVRNAAIRALVRLVSDRDETIAALIEALHSPAPTAESEKNPFSPEDAAWALAGIGPKAKAALPELARYLNDPNDDLREAVATALWKIDRDTSVVPILAERLSNASNYQSAVRVMKLLGEIGPQAKIAVPVLQKKIEEPGISFIPSSGEFEQAALEALTKIDPASAEKVRGKLKR
jgi:HEAT repeat protein